MQHSKVFNLDEEISVNTNCLYTKHLLHITLAANHNISLIKSVEQT